jgi:mannose-6-phosphate isomerase
MRKIIQNLTPYYSPTIWGGSLLAAQKGWTQDKLPLGESWEVSRLEGKSSLLQDDGRDLSQLVTASQIPYMVKFIDTAKDLSIQVHPDDQYAKTYENSSGKSEMWIILQAEQGAGIYLGFRPGVTPNHLTKMAKSGGAVDSLLNFYPVLPGDSFFVPAGSIHAIGAGITLLEIQQSSGITYRVWDWNRLGLDGKSRPLHLTKAMDVLNFNFAANNKEYYKFCANTLKSSQLIATHEEFNVSSIKLAKKESVLLPPAIGERYSSIVCLAGGVELVCSAERVALKAFTTLLFAREGEEEITITASDSPSTLILIR